MWHFCLCLRLTANQRGTLACMEGLKGPASPLRERGEFVKTDQGFGEMVVDPY